VQADGLPDVLAGLQHIIDRLCRLSVTVRVRVS